MLILFGLRGHVASRRRVRPRSAAVVVGVLLAFGAATVCAAPDPCGPGTDACYQTYVDAASKSFRETFTADGASDDGHGVWWSHRFVQPQARYARFRFDAINAPAGTQYRVRIVRLPAEEEIASYRAAEFAREDTFMTGLLPAGDLRLDLVADQKPAGLSFRFDRALWQAQSTQAVPRTPVFAFKTMASMPAGSPIAALEPAIAKLHIGPTETSCTGVLVREGKLLTNYHCMLQSLVFLKTEQAKEPSCADVLVEFDYLNVGKLGKTTPCLGVRASPTLDLAVLTIDTAKIPAADGKPRKPLVVRPDEEKAPAALVLIHHPLGLPMSVQEHCETPSLTAGDVLHDCLSTSGSSGSALIDDKLQLFALHYKGAYPNDWTNAQMEKDVAENGPRFNKGRPAHALVEFLDAGSS